MLGASLEDQIPSLLEVFSVVLLTQLVAPGHHKDARRVALVHSIDLVLPLLGVLDNITVSLSGWDTNDEKVTRAADKTAQLLVSRGMFDSENLDLVSIDFFISCLRQGHRVIWCLFPVQVKVDQG